MKTVIATAVLCAAFTSSVIADNDRPDHFKGAQVGSLTEAVSVFRATNQKLQQLLQEDLTPAAMVEIHQLTYTLENALDKIHNETSQLKVVLEEVHLGSESMDFDKVKKNSALYLDAATTLIK
tara:strand:+ start:3395 stop:3763 length:369 start_codon:yes stop_codon:yes gene_type:complete